MAYQTGKNVRTAYKQQAAFGTPETGAGATGFLFTPGNGIQPGVADVPSETVRADGQTVLGRNGSRSWSAVYPAEARVGAFDPLFAAGVRSNWNATFDILPADITSVTVQTDGITGGSGSFLTKGVRIGDWVKPANLTDAANNGKWFPVVGVTASKITTPAGSLTANATPDTTFTLSIAKTLVNGAAPVERYFTFEDYLADIAASVRAWDGKVNRFTLNAQPNKNVALEFSLLGRDWEPLDSTTTPVAPNFSSPTYSTAKGLVMSNGFLRIAGTDYTAALTSFQLVYDLGGDATATLGPVPADVFLDGAKLSGSFSGLLADLAWLKAARAETIVDFFIGLKEIESEPADFFGLYVGTAKLAPGSTNLGSEGPLNPSFNWTGGIDETGGSRAATTLKLATSAP